MSGALLLVILLVGIALLITREKQKHAEFEAKRIFIIFVTIWETCHIDTIAGKLENYQIIVVMEPITAPTVGKLCFKFVRRDFGGDFEELALGRRGKDTSGDL